MVECPRCGVILAKSSSGGGFVQRRPTMNHPVPKPPGRAKGNSWTAIVVIALICACAAGIMYGINRNRADAFAGDDASSRRRAEAEYRDDEDDILLAKYGGVLLAAVLGYFVWRSSFRS